MKVQVRKGVFETNSSSTHSLTYYKTQDWEDFMNGKKFMDQSLLGSILTEEELYESYESEEMCSWGSKNPTPEGFEAYKKDCYTYDDICERYDVIECEIADTGYTAVSIEGYN